MKIVHVIILASMLAASGRCETTPVSFQRDVKPILEKNCVICHACYDAPCQLKMETPAGLERGASKAPVYGPGVKDRPTSRLFVDANSTEEWRRRGFVSVLEGGPGSLLGRMLELGKAQAAQENAPVPSDVVMGLARKNECPTRDEFDKYSHRHMHEGMPFGMAPLDPADYETLQRWLKLGAPLDGPDATASASDAMIGQWEDFLNRAGKRERLLARYLYEHLFVAHLYFDRKASSGFYELVRSTTPSGQPIHVVPTRRPTDDPGDGAFYRLRPITGSIVEKTHITYYFGPEKLARVQSLFDSEKWDVDQLPLYPRNGSANPFLIFQAIPAKLRYRFMLDDAHYFLQCFIRGPVCLGQVATDVIEDHFHAMWQTPESDLFCTDPAYANEQLQDISLDGREGFSIDVLPKWTRAEMRYHKRRNEKYASDHGLSWKDLWDGDGGANPDACETIFRSFDSATVIRGLRGRVPKTIWVMDYPIFERIYYLLVANFDVFGSASHQIGTRLYFDLLRVESEVNFLRFLPKEGRKMLFASWYRDNTAWLKSKAIYPGLDEKSGTQTGLQAGDAAAFVSAVRARMPAVAGPAGDMSGATSPALDAAARSGDSDAVDAAIASLGEGVASERPVIGFTPETTFIRVEVDGKDGDLAYSLSHVKAHASVATMFRENARLEPEKDYLVPLRGPVGCYPNFIFHVPKAKLADFTAKFMAVASAQDWTALVDLYGVRRTHPHFWDDFQFFWKYHQRRDAVEAGIYDAIRYANY